MRKTSLTDTRRNVIKRIATGVGITSLAAPASARSNRWIGRRDGDHDNGDEDEGGFDRDENESGPAETPFGRRGDARGVHLVDGPGEFKIFVSKAQRRSGVSADSPDTDAAFGYPDEPAIASEDPPGGLFDASEIVKSPDGNVLHHRLQFFQGALMCRPRAKPYVLIHEGDGRFRSRGERVFFRARRTAGVKARLRQLGVDPGLADVEPLATLAGGTWYAAGEDIVQFVGDPAESRQILWSVTRIDFFELGRGRPSYELSALYVLYPNLDRNGQLVPANPENPAIGPTLPPAREAGHQLVAAGRTTR